MSVKPFVPSVSAWSEKLRVEFPAVWEKVRGLSAPDALKACYPDQWPAIKGLAPYDGIALIWNERPAP